jgi:Mannosyl-glycoprotein endo-beta-N-acetylglucosaminidase
MRKVWTIVLLCLAGIAALNMTTPHHLAATGVAMTIHAPAIMPTVPGAMHTVYGQPSITASFIDHVLCAASSPACGTGQALYDSGKLTGIDPAYALAFFWHESQFGKYGVARTNKGIGNIRCTSGYSCLYGFRMYPTWQAGYVDWYGLIAWYGTALHKWAIETIVPTYAPPGDNNDTPAYIQSVLASVTAWRIEGRAA